MSSIHFNPERYSKYARRSPKQTHGSHGLSSNVKYYVIYNLKKQPNKQKKLCSKTRAKKQRVDSASGTELHESSSALTVCSSMCAPCVCALFTGELPLNDPARLFSAPPSYLDLVQPSWSGSLPCTTDRGEHILPAPPVQFGRCVLRTCWRAFKQII